jgi:hypothetical protein
MGGGYKWQNVEGQTFFKEGLNEKFLIIKWKFNKSPTVLRK